VLHPDICRGSHEGILAVHSLSKRSNLAGYRCAFVAGDRAVVAELLPGAPELVLPVAGRAEIALVSAKGSLHERLRVPLPAPAETGIVVLGEGAAARLLVGLADGRVAVVAPDGGKP
jgi:hypothetical protein